MGPNLRRLVLFKTLEYYVYNSGIALNSPEPIRLRYDHAKAERARQAAINYVMDMFTALRAAPGPDPDGIRGMSDEELSDYLYPRRYVRNG